MHACTHPSGSVPSMILLNTPPWPRRERFHRWPMGAREGPTHNSLEKFQIRFCIAERRNDRRGLASSLMKRAATRLSLSLSPSTPFPPLSSKSVCFLLEEVAFVG